MTYDSGGRLLSRTDFNGKITSYAYDNMNRLLSKTPDASFNAPSVRFTYTRSGKRLTMADASGNSNYTYDSMDRLLSLDTPEGTLFYTYDAAGNLNSVHSGTANGVNNMYQYDALNRLVSVTDNRRNGVTAYSYDDAGNLSSFSYPNGVQTNLAYDTLNRLTEITTTRGQPVCGYSYNLGPAGNRLSVSELNGRQVSYLYDDLYRLKAETISGDPLTTNNGGIRYDYDSVGNRLSRVSEIPSVSTTSNSFDDNDRSNTESFDSNGNTLASNGNSYTYDFENRILGENGNSAAFIYDGDGNRVGKTVNGSIVKYLIDPNNLTGISQIVEESQNGTLQRVYAYGHALISEDQIINTAWKQSFYGYDGLGSVRFLTDTVGTVTDRYDYDGFGILISKEGSTPNNVLFAGEQFDADLGFYYLRARYMNPQSGRFLTMDTFEGEINDPLSLHKYVYARNCPIDRVDPSGHIDWSALGQSFMSALQNALTTIRLAFQFPAVAYAQATAAAATFALENLDIALVMAAYGLLMDAFRIPGSQYFYIPLILADFALGLGVPDLPGPPAPRKLTPNEIGEAGDQMMTEKLQRAEDAGNIRIVGDGQIYCETEDGDRVMDRLIQNNHTGKYYQCESKANGSRYGGDQPLKDLHIANGDYTFHGQNADKAGLPANVGPIETIVSPSTVVVTPGGGSPGGSGWSGTGGSAGAAGAVGAASPGGLGSGDGN